MVKASHRNTFIAKAIASGACVKQFSNFEEALDFVSLFLKREKIQNITVAPDAISLIKKRSEIRVFKPCGPKDFLSAEAALVLADYGVGETGSLVHLDRNDEEKMAWTLPPLCFSLLLESRIVPDLESLSSIFAQHLSQTAIPSPQISVVTGPSRTGDIEGQLFIGAQGPSTLIILLVEGKPE